MDYFKLNPETIFTHLNKSTYTNQEQLWFKSYVYDTKTQKPYFSTTNLYATIYDEKGVFVEQKLFYAEDGMAHGDFKLKKKYAPGIYFLEVSTNWMKNFNEKHQSRQQFEILGDETPLDSSNPSKPLYDFQLLAEGGKYLNNVINSIGFKVIDQNGDGVEIESGSVTNSKNDIIFTFKSNKIGIGKFNILLEDKDNYIVSVFLKDGTQLKKTIEGIQIRGISMAVNNLNPDRLLVNLKTNASTLPELVNKSYYLVLHRDGMIKKIDVIFEADKLNYVIAIPKSELFSGITILTLFNGQNQPILERMVFNKRNMPIEKLMLLRVSKLKDSVEISLRAERMDTQKKHISVSVLPAATKAYDIDSNIKSTFLLEPYVNGYIENVAYYFKDSDRKTDYDLDLLLLTQGWSSYSWKNIFYLPHKAIYDFEKGIQIKGKLNSGNNNEKSEIFLYSPDNELLISSVVNKDNMFNFENLFIADSTSISLGVRDKKNQISYSGLYYNIFPNPQKDNISIENWIKQRPVQKPIFSKTDFIYDDAVLLDTVSIIAIKKPKNHVIRGAFDSRSIDLGKGFSETTRLIDVIRQNGFEVIEGGFSGIQINSRRAASIRGPASPRVYLDNFEISDFLVAYINIPLNQIEGLYVSTSSSIYGAGGNIHIFTKPNYSTKSNKSNFNTSLVNFGFSSPEAYYSPRYNKSQRDLFSNYGVIHWIPDLKINQNNEFVFKIPSDYYKTINLYINGMSSDGSLISKIETVDINQIGN